LKSILYISLIDWYFAKQRPQHFAEQLSKEFKIKYICQMPIIDNGIKLKQFNNTWRIKEVDINNNLEVSRKVLLPGSRYKLTKSINHYLFKNYIKKLCKSNNFSSIWLTHPMQLGLVPTDFIGEVYYDCMDNYPEFSNNIEVRNQINEMEKKLCIRAKKIFTSSSGLSNKILTYLPSGSDKVVLVHNAGDFSHFNSAYNFKNEIQKDNNPTIGYFGTIGKWFDVELLVKLARKLPEMNFVIIGPIGNKDIILETKEIDNIKLLGPKDFSELPSFLESFDVCIMPFLINSLVQDVNPVKIYEYLAAGKPVVATSYDELAEFKENIYLASGSEEFEKRIREAIQDDSETLRLNRIDYASKHTWEVRSKVIIDNLY
jgi:teichuronic acid biosynthesis glycosyltransferase TuaH